jgi:sec-independent protein translocase protein TatA
MNTVILFISGQEIFVIMLFALLFFGSKKIPDVARGLGKGLRELKKATEDIKKEIQDNSSEVVKDIKEIEKKVNED